MADGLKENGLVPVNMSGGKRANLITSDDWDWHIGFGKEQSCQFEGPWLHMAILAARILAHPNTKVVAPNLFVELALTDEQERSY